MNRKTLILIILITLTPTFVAAASPSLENTLQGHLNYIWNFLAAAFIFFIKSRGIM
ncbi:hypothetical protein [Candidatus Electrothrix sp.]|uniref:hypothetical protein n=1 Tax=Candidatus Electrothrix sp. TaxID=2170559 RepID=UPI004057B6E7